MGGLIGVWLSMRCCVVLLDATVGGEGSGEEDER